MARKYLVCDVKLLGAYIEKVINVDYRITPHGENPNVGKVSVLGLSDKDHNAIRKFITKRDIWLF